MLLYNFVIIARPDLFPVRVTSVNKSTPETWGQNGPKDTFICLWSGDLDLKSLKFKNLELMTFESVEFKVESWVSLTQDV